jgi:allophanate hydrolase subunit 1
MQAAPAGDNAVLLDLGDVSAAELHAAARTVSAMSGVTACIVGHSSLYVIGRGRILDFGLPILDSGGNPKSKIQNPKSIPVSFEGAPDLPEFLERTGVALPAFLSRVAMLRLTVRYLGFRGGFAYLDGWPEEWAMPRCPTSRPVARGSFAIAGNVAGFYPIDSPGGWNVLGRTEENLEHALMPGDVLTIEPMDRRRPGGWDGGVSPPSGSERRDAARPAGEDAGGPLQITNLVEIISAPLATIVREPDYSLLARGIPAGGPFDDVAAALARRAVGQCETLLECAMVGPRLRFRDDAVVAWCGPDLSVRVHRGRAGEELSIGRITGGLRGYLAIGRAEGVIAHVERGDRLVIRAMRGPHDVGLTEVECEVTPRLDRVGVRLRPLIALNVPIPADLRSSGMQLGTVQLHPDGSMVAMGPDHPVTGGYLQPMTVLTSERWKLGQLTPGERVTFLAQPPN